MSSASLRLQIATSLSMGTSENHLFNERSSLSLFTQNITFSICLYLNSAVAGCMPYFIGDREIMSTVFFETIRSVVQ